MCQMIRPACVVANFFASTGRETVQLRELRRVCESAEKTANDNDCVIDWSRYAVMAISDEYGDLFIIQDGKVRKTKRFEEYARAEFVENEFNYCIPSPVIESLRTGFGAFASAF